MSDALDHRVGEAMRPDGPVGNVKTHAPAEEHTGTRADGLIRRGLGIVAGYARTHPWPFAISVLGSLAMAVGTVMSAVVLGWLTDDLVLPTFDGTEATRTRTAVIAAVLIVAVIRSGGVVVRRYFAGMAVFRVTSDLQIRLGDHYLDLPADQLRVAPKGRLLAHVDSDVRASADMLSPFPFAIGVVTLLAVSVVSLSLVDWVLTAVAVAMLPAIVVLNRLNANAAKGPAIDERESVARVSEAASESFDGAIVVKTLGRQNEELDGFSRVAATLRDDAVRLARIRALFSAALDFLPDVGIVLLVSLGAWRVANGHISTGELVQAVALFSLLVFPLRVIGYFFGDMPPGIVAHDRLAAAFARPTSPSRGDHDVADGPIGVSLAGAVVSHGGVTALDGVSLDVAPGEVVALVGSTGCGKSTLLMALADMVRLDAGSVTIAGADLTSLDPMALSRRMAVAWQEPFLLDATVRDNIAFGAQLSDVQIVAAAESARFGSVAKELPEGFDTVVGERGVRLSGGQRQRLALARAIARRPGILLLDDATSAVDPVVEEQILGEIRTLGSTMVIVAHRRSTIALADRVVLMRAGQIIDSGTHETLLSNPVYAALLEAYDTDDAEDTGRSERGDVPDASPVPGGG